MIFRILLILSTLSIAGSAAFFSVYGLANTFNSIFWLACFAFGALELGKLVIASALYRYWSYLGWLLKTYLCITVVAFMALTSAGIFGYLTSSYQTDSLPLEQINTKIELYEDELDRLVDRKRQMDQQIAQMPENYITARQRLMESFKSEYDKINPRIDNLTSSIQELKSKKIQTESKVGPILFVAKSLGLNPEKAIIYLITFIVLFFDPVAVALTIVANIAFEKRKQEKKENMSIQNNTKEKDDGLGYEKEVKNLETDPDDNNDNILNEIKNTLGSLKDTVEKSNKKEELIRETRRKD